MWDSRQKENKVDDIIIDNKNQNNETEKFLTNENKTLNNYNHVKNTSALQNKTQENLFFIHNNTGVSANVETYSGK